MQDIEHAVDDAALQVTSGDRDRPMEVRAIQPPETERLCRQLPQQHARGWLLFTLGVERRRLAPLPPGWRHASPDQFRRWWDDAEPVRAPSDDAGFRTSVIAPPS